MNILHLNAGKTSEAAVTSIASITSFQSQNTADQVISIVPADVPLTLSDRKPPLLKAISTSFHLFKIIRKYGIDLVHCHSNTSARLAKFPCRITRTALVLSCYSPEEAEKNQATSNIIVDCELTRDAARLKNGEKSEITIIRYGIENR